MDSRRKQQPLSPLQTSSLNTYESFFMPPQSNLRFSVVLRGNLWCITPSLLASGCCQCSLRALWFYLTSYTLMKFSSGLPERRIPTGESWSFGQKLPGWRIKILPCHEPCNHFLYMHIGPIRYKSGTCFRLNA